MLILQIAAGIVLAVLLLLFLPQVVRFAAWAVVACVLLLVAGFAMSASLAALGRTLLAILQVLAVFLVIGLLFLWGSAQAIDDAEKKSQWTFRAFPTFARIAEGLRALAARVRGREWGSKAK